MHRGQNWCYHDTDDDDRGTHDGV
ncbi:ORFS364W.iORF1 [Human betaherpesvirus 5]|nr:ORFS364W.iORF1 [Human betaherpesvirus 5]QHX40734.1 ORFS364W.iORF1 [Human betaherpesvirus 5]